MQTSGDFYLVFSNITMVLAAVYAFSRKLYATASISTTVGVVSTFYHLCQRHFYCILETDLSQHSSYKFLQYSDEFFVDTLVIWYILFFLEVKKEYITAVIFLTQPIFLLSILSNSGHTITIVYVTIFSILFFALVRSIILYRRIYIEFGSGIIALILLIGGFLNYYFAGVYEDKYATLHSTWHILLMLALFFIIRSKITVVRYYIILEVDKRPIKLIDVKSGEILFNYKKG